ncbi:PucR family transcriptional regulator [Tsukamurella asaccharolytica]|uniref:PucR family transcriptional regulator n=1 Tax=Tsukamurella asaccharolytica TaxID=2592067 RepID=UPI0013157A2D|nr:PucR family transcriptional regulator [Tsukamurella asaccharolytica]
MANPTIVDNDRNDSATPTYVASELQRLVDSLAQRLGRSVAIDDAHIRILAYSAHVDEVDTARTSSILCRTVPTDLYNHVVDHGASRAHDVFTVPARHEYGMSVDRIGMPIRHGRNLHGYLWLLGSDGPVSDRNVAVLREASCQAALLLHRGSNFGEGIRARERELVRDLVASEEALRFEAADALIEEELVTAGTVTALVVTVDHEYGTPLGDETRQALRTTIEYARRRLPPGRTLTLDRPDHSLLLAVFPPGRQSSIDHSVCELASAMYDRLAVEAPAVGFARACVGIGTTQERLSDAGHSYTEARQAATTGNITGSLGNTVAYSQLGVYALLAKIPRAELAECLHPGVQLLLDPAAKHDELVVTIRAYLDNAADVQRTAQQLHIHRATLYYRLKRVEEITGLDLSDGNDRLSAHLSLKLALLFSGPDHP